MLDWLDTARHPRFKRPYTSLVYQPMLLGAAEIHYTKSKSVDVTQQVTLLAPFSDGPIDLNWDQAQAIELPVEDLEAAGCWIVEIVGAYVDGRPISSSSSACTSEASE